MANHSAFSCCLLFICLQYYCIYRSAPSPYCGVCQTTTALRAGCRVFVPFTLRLRVQGEADLLAAVDVGGTNTRVVIEAGGMGGTKRIAVRKFTQVHTASDLVARLSSVAAVVEVRKLPGY
jgi:hypothetical protein